MGGQGQDTGNVQTPGVGGSIGPMAKIAKAITAAIGAGVGAAASVLTAAASTHPLGITDLELAIGAAIVIGAGAGWATWRIPNAA